MLLGYAARGPVLFAFQSSFASAKKVLLLDRVVSSGRMVVLTSN